MRHSGMAEIRINSDRLNRRDNDRGSMPVTRSNLHQSSYLRKFVGYASTYRNPSPKP